MKGADDAKKCKDYNDCDCKYINIQIGVSVDTRVIIYAMSTCQGR